MDSAKSRTLKANLTDAEYKSFQASLGHVNQVDAVRSIVLWFTDQDEVVRTAILGVLPRSLRPDIARLVLEKMARPKRGKPRTDQ